jgi:hypothetical protein
MTAYHFGTGLTWASISGTSGLKISDLYVPEGFAGGGAYINLPATAIDPKAPSNAPGNPRCPCVGMMSSHHRTMSHALFVFLHQQA